MEILGCSHTVILYEAQRHDQWVGAYLVTAKKRSHDNGCNGEVLEQKKGSWIVPQRMKGWLVEDARTMAKCELQVCQCHRCMFDSSALLT